MYKLLQASWYILKSTPEILAFQPEGKGIPGKLLAIFFARV